MISNSLVHFDHSVLIKIEDVRVNQSKTGRLILLRLRTNQPAGLNFCFSATDLMLNFYLNELINVLLK